MNLSSDINYGKIISPMVIIIFSIIPYSFYNIILISIIFAEPVPDDNGIIMFNYHGVQRKVYNPLNVATSGLSYFSKYENTGDKQFKKYFINTANWLVNNAKDKEGGNYSIWEYDFPWRYYGWITPPYYSSLAQATGISVLTHAYDLTNNETYLDKANRAFRAFLVEYDKGGLMTIEDDGASRFYHLLAKPGFPKIYVLNGHTGTLIYLWQYYERNHDPQIKSIFDKGINYLKQNLWKYDTGSWSLYDQMENLSTVAYQKMHINQLKILYDISGEPILKAYADKFKKYLSNMPLNSTS